MPKMSPGDLRALLAAEKADALSAMSASKLSGERSRALDYYLGDMSRDMPAPERAGGEHRLPDLQSELHRSLTEGSSRGGFF
jgi:hypothetical protein